MKAETQNQDSKYSKFPYKSLTSFIFSILFKFHFKFTLVWNFGIQNKKIGRLLLSIILLHQRKAIPKGIPKPFQTFQKIPVQQ